MLQGKIGSIVAIEPATGEVLAMASSPTYDPRYLIGRKRSKAHKALSKDVWKPLLNRSIMGLYPPGSTFKTTQALTYLTEGIITPNTMFTCHHGFFYRGLHVGCHGHVSPLNLVEAISTSCNAYFCWGLYYMLGNRRKYGSVQNAMNRWRDYMVSMGLGYKLGIDLPGEKRGLIPNASFYDHAYRNAWNGLTVISISIGQGEINLTPLQIANLGATIANRGYFYTPHVVRKVQGLPSTLPTPDATAPWPPSVPTVPSSPACARRCSKAPAATSVDSHTPSAERPAPRRTTAATIPSSWGSHQWTVPRWLSPFTWRTEASAPTSPYPLQVYSSSNT